MRSKVRLTNFHQAIGGHLAIPARNILRPGPTVHQANVTNNKQLYHGNTTRKKKKQKNKKKQKQKKKTTNNFTPIQASKRLL